MFQIFFFGRKIIIIFCCLFFVAFINAQLNPAQNFPTFSCRSIQASPNHCNFQDLSNKFIIEEFFPFLEQLDFQEAETFKSIIEDLKISKSDAKIKLIKFAFTLSENLKQLFIILSENSVKNVKMIEKQFDKIIENASLDSRIVYFQIKNIYKNDNLTLAEECQQINTVINISPPTVIKELENIFGSLAKCNPVSSSANENVNNFKASESFVNPNDFNKGLLIPENDKTPSNNFDLNQFLGGLNNNNNNNNNLGINPLNNGLDLLGNFNEVILLAKNLNNLINGLQSLFNLNLNGLKMPNGFNLGTILPPSNNNNNNLNTQNPFSNFNWNNLLLPPTNNQAMNYPNYNSAISNNNNNNILRPSMYSNQNAPTFRNPFFPNFPNLPYSA